MKPLGIDLSVLAAGASRPAPDLESRCPGASLMVTRDDLADLVRLGGQFALSSETIPAKGYGTARVWCTRPVEQVTGPNVRGTYFYGLCASCSQDERDNRATLTQRAAKAPGTQVPR